MYGQFEMITLEEMTSPEMLEDHILYADEWLKMTKEEQIEYRKYCRLHATCKGCIKNLEQMRFAIEHIYFGDTGYYKGC